MSMIFMSNESMSILTSYHDKCGIWRIIMFL